MAVKQGDFLLLNYTLKVKESGETVDTTFETVAKESNIHKEGTLFAPKFVIVGEGWLPKGLDDHLLGLEPGKPTTVELTPEKGYGARDPAKMRLVPLRRFREKEIDPVPGTQIEFDGRPAVVRAVGAGRVQVDYNHPLAGRTLIYDLSIERVLDEENEKVLSIISRRLPEISSQKFSLQKHATGLTIEVPEEAFYLSGLQVAKKAITSDVQKYFPEIDTISFLEVFKKPEATIDAEPTPTPKNVEPIPQKEIRDEQQMVSKAHEETPSKRRPATPKRAGSKTTRRRPHPGSENQR